MVPIAMTMMTTPTATVTVITTSNFSVQQQHDTQTILRILRSDKIQKTLEQVAQLSLTNPHYTLHYGKRQNFNTVT